MYLQIETGNSPLIITVPHDGGIKIAGAPIRPEIERWTREFGEQRDQGALACAIACRQSLVELGMSATLITFDLHRGHVDVNRDPDREPFVVPDEHQFADVYRGFQTEIDRAAGHSLSTFDRCLLIDVHTFCDPPRVPLDIVLGTNAGRTCSAALSQEICRFLSERYQIGHSPDREHGITGRYSGGYVVRGTADRFHQARVSNRFDAIQVEICRQPTFLEHPEIVGTHLAQAIFLTLQRERG